MKSRELLARRGVVGALLGVVALGCSSSRPPPPPPPLPSWCTRPAPVTRRGAVATLRYQDWIALLLRGQQPGTAPGNNVRDCSDRAIDWRFHERCMEDEPGEEPIPPRPLVEDDVVVSRVANNTNQRLVWIKVRRYVPENDFARRERARERREDLVLHSPCTDAGTDASATDAAAEEPTEEELRAAQEIRENSGEAIGPVALVEFTAREVAVRALGTLRLPPKRVRMRLETLGNRRVLVAEGEACLSDDVTTCQRAVRVLPIVQVQGRQVFRFEQVPLVLRRDEAYDYLYADVDAGRRDAGADAAVDPWPCVGPARFDYSRSRTVVLPTGWHRTFQQITALSFRDGALRVHEQVVVDDYDPARCAVPARPFRRADTNRRVTYEGGRLVTTAPSLWDRIVWHRGSVGADAGVAPDAGGDGGVDATTGTTGNWR